MYELAKFGLKEMTECGAFLRTVGQGAKSMEETSDKIVRYFYDQFADPSGGKKACALARLFKTHPYGNLDQDRQGFARDILGDQPPAPEMKCLTLLATAGDLPEWNSPAKSNGHKTIPLASEKFVMAVPMIANLVRQLGLEIKQVVQPESDIILDIAKKKYNVFHVPNALGSPMIPSQDNFVVPFGIKSVIGFGGVFPSGNLFAVILFTKVDVKREIADLFKTVALDIKLALLPFENKVFA